MMRLFGKKTARIPMDDEERSRALETSEAVLEEARQLQEKAAPVAQSARKHSNQNHFAERILHAYRPGN